MKKILHILFPVLLMAVSCYPETLPEYSKFNSSAVGVGTDNGITDELSRLLILNENVFPAYSSVDLLDFKTNRYYPDLFTQANPHTPQNMGVEATQMAVVYGQLWVLLYTSCQIAIMDLPSFTILEYIPVDFPRQMVIEEGYVYISSYGVAPSAETSAVGKVYKINAATRKVEYVNIGLQPEGLAVLGDKLYVADSGHLHWPRGKTVNVINLKKFKKEQAVDLPERHPNQVIARGGRLWVTTMGDSDVNSVEYEGEPPLTHPHSLIRMGVNGSGRVVEGVHAEKMVLDHHTLYIYGNVAELSGGTEWHLYKVDADGDEVIDIPFKGTDLAKVKHPNSINVNPNNGDIYLVDVDSDGNSTLFNFDKEFKYKWSVPTGIRTSQVVFW